MARRAARVRLGLFGLVLVGCSVAAARWGTDAPDRLRSVVDDAGPLGPVAFIIAYAVLTVAMVPGTVGSTLAGLIFGPAVGTLVTVIGATVGATGSFGIGRRIGRSSVEALVGGRAQRVDEFIGQHPLRSMLALRLTPIFPFNVLNYAAGLSRVGLRDYVLGTAVGITPGTFAFVALGSSLEQPGSARFFWSIGLLVALTAAGAAVVRVGRNHD